MIKINLLGDDTVKDHRGPLYLAAYGASVLVFLIAFFFINSSLNSQLEDVAEQTRQSEVQLAKLKEKTKEVRDLEAKRDELQKITLAIATLKKSQEGPVRLLDDINSAIPERGWLTSIDIKGGVIQMTGMVLNDGSLVSFLKKLEESKYFERIDLTDRLAVPLSQITTYNSFDGIYNRYIVRGEVQRIQSKMSELEKEAKDLGLTFFKGQPGEGLSRGAAGISSQNPNKGKEADARMAKSGVSTRGSQYSGKPMMYAWASLEKVDGILFTIDGRVRYTPRFEPKVQSAADAKPAGGPA